MVTRFYFENATTHPAAILPGGTTGWNDTGQERYGALTRTKRSSAFIGGVVTANGVSGHLHLAGRFVSSPLNAQTISGTIKGQIRCNESSAADNFTIAIGVKIIKPDGTDRAVLLSPIASDDTSTTPPEMATSATNRKFLDASESASISLTSQSATEGDLLVIDVGFRGGNTTASCVISIGSASATDLAEDNTTTTANNPWVEFDTDLQFQPIYWYGTTVNPADSSPANEPLTPALTPPSAMLTGDLVIIGGFNRNTSANQIAQSNLGGQTWTALLDDTAVGSNNMNCAYWFCEYNGTWSADPSIDFAAQGGTIPVTAVMHVFRGATGWAIDVAAAKAAFASGATITITAQDPVANNTITVAAWHVGSLNAWTAVAGANWQNLGQLAYTNPAGSDQSATYAYVYVANGTAPANVSKTQDTSTAGLSFIGTIKGTVPAADTSVSVPSANLALSMFVIDRILATYRDPISANLVLSTFTPDRVLATCRDPVSGNLVLSMVAPTIIRSVTMRPDADITADGWTAVN